MAGDWIKVESTTPDKPEIHAMAKELNITPEQVLGGLIRVWAWADQQSIDGNGLSVTFSVLDRIGCVTGLASAMRSAGWLSGVDGALKLPNFTNHNGKTAKDRAVTLRRVKRFRNGADVTQALPEVENRGRGTTTAATAFKDSPTSTKKKERTPPRISFDYTAGKFVGVTTEIELAWQEAYPDVQVPVEIAKAAAWLMANRQRAKKDFERFLNNWLGVEQRKLTDRLAYQAHGRVAVAR